MKQGRLIACMVALVAIVVLGLPNGVLAQTESYGSSFVDWLIDGYVNSLGRGAEATGLTDEFLQAAGIARDVNRFIAGAERDILRGVDRGVNLFHRVVTGRQPGNVFLDNLIIPDVHEQMARRLENERTRIINSRLEKPSKLDENPTDNRVRQEQPDPIELDPTYIRLNPNENQPREDKSKRCSSSYYSNSSAYWRCMGDEKAARQAEISESTVQDKKNNLLKNMM